MDISQKVAATTSLILMLAIFITVALPRSNWIQVYWDDFEDFPGDWSIDTREYGSVAKSSIRSTSGASSLRISTPYATDNACAYLRIPGSSTKDLHIQLWFYVDYAIPADHVYILNLRNSKSMENNRIVVDNEGGTCIVKQLLPGNGYDLANYANICPVTENAWHKLDYYWRYTRAEYIILIDDVEYGTYTPPYPTTSVDYLYLGDSTVGGFKGLLYFDELTIERPR